MTVNGDSGRPFGGSRYVAAGLQIHFIAANDSNCAVQKAWGPYTRIG